MAAIVNYQDRAAEFAVGDQVVICGLPEESGGTIVALWPAIGMADVEFPGGNKRLPVEEMQKLDPRHSDVSPPEAENIPGGEAIHASSNRVARAFINRSLHTARVNRLDGDFCPGCETSMKLASYGPGAVRVCPKCLFVVGK